MLAAGPPEEGDPLELAAAPRHLARITSASQQHLAAAAIAPGGRCIAASDSQATRLFAVEVHGDAGGAAADADGAALGVRRIKPPAPLPPALALAFSCDGGVLFAADTWGAIHAVSAADGSVAATARPPAPPPGASTSGRGAAAAAAQPPFARHLPAVSHMAASPDGRWLAAARPGGVQLLQLPGLAHHAWLLTVGEPEPVTGLAFSSDGDTLAVTSGSAGLAAYDVASGAPSQWTLDHGEAATELLDQLPGPILGLSFCPARGKAGGSSGGGKGEGDGGEGGGTLVVYSAGGLCHVDLAAPVSAAHLHEKRRRGRTRPAELGAAASARGRNCRLLLLENPCLFFGFSAPDAALLVEKPWLEVLQQLPPPMFRHRYGA